MLAFRGVMGPGAALPSPSLCTRNRSAAPFIRTFPFTSTQAAGQQQQQSCCSSSLPGSERPVRTRLLSPEYSVCVRGLERTRALWCRAGGVVAHAGAVEKGVAVGEWGERMEAGDVKLECDESGCVIVLSSAHRDLARADEASSSAGVLQCDVTGCYYGPSPGPNDFKVVEGQGWRLGYETVPDSEDSFSAMVGAGGWSIGLTASEFHDFCTLIQMLRKGIITMDQDGTLGRDDIVMQVEVGSLWMECVLPKKVLPTLQKFLKFGGKGGSSAFEIRFILTGKLDKRQAEGYWPAEAVLDMLRKIDELTAERKAVAGSSAVQAVAV